MFKFVNQNKRSKNSVSQGHVTLPKFMLIGKTAAVFAIFQDASRPPSRILRNSNFNYRYGS